MLSMYERGVIHELEDNGVFLIPATGQWVMLNTTGKLLMEKRKEGLTLLEIIEFMKDKYRIPEDIIAKDVQSFFSVVERYIYKHEKSVVSTSQPCAVSSDSKQMTIHLTNQCNLFCPYCYKNAGESYDEELRAEDWIHICSQAYREGFKSFVISGGEPTLKQGWETIIGTLKRIHEDCHVALLTNGTTDLTDEQVEVICSRVDSLQISLDGPNAEVNDRTRGEGSFAKTVQLIGRLLEKGYRSFYLAATPYTTGMATQNSVQEMNKLLRFAANLGARGLYINHLKPDGRLGIKEYLEFNQEEFWHNIDLTYENYFSLMQNGYFKEKNGEGQDFSCFASSDFIGILSGQQKKTSCGLGCNEICVDSDGQVYPCSSLIHEELRLGNVCETDFKAIYRRSRSIYEKQDVDHLEQCSSCDFRYICGGGCRAMAFYFNGSTCADEPACNVHKKRMYKWMALANSLHEEVRI